MARQVIRRELVNAAIKIAADSPRPRNNRSMRYGVKRTLVEELRRELDLAGFGDDWRTLQDIIRREEREGVSA